MFRVYISDLHVVLDHVQFEKNSYVNRNKIINGNESQWLTVPLQTKGKFGELNINSLKINNSINWKKKHWLSIQNNYSKTSYFHHYADFFEYVYSKEWTYLAEICKEITNYLLQQLGINTEIKYSSEITIEGKKSELILNICDTENADIYLSGPLGRNYLDEQSFLARKINIKYHDYKHPVYQQRSVQFVPNLNILDLLFNHGKKSLDIIVSDNNFK